MQGTDHLLELQVIDTAVDRLTARRRMLASETEVTAARSEADAAEDVLGELGLKIEAVGRDQKRIEHEVDSLSQKSAAEDRRLYDGSIVNTKELASLQREIENLTRRRSDREDELLGMMEELERLEARSALARTESERQRALAEQIAASAGAELVQIAAELETRAAERAALVSAIDPEVLELYDDLRAQKKGIGAVALVDGVCQGCHEKLSAMEMDRIKHTEGIRRCEHCRRIVILQ
jgi:predicted  nucleic acid-binding Zn-ribbon protein